MAVGSIAAAHLVLGVATHGEHVLHVALDLGFLLPIVAGAAWFGLRGGLLTGVAAAILPGAHVALGRGQPMENMNQLATMIVFVVVGALSGALVDAERRERARRLDGEQRATREKVVEALTALQSALAYRHDGTRGHGERVAELAVCIDRRRDLDPTGCASLRSCTISARSASPTTCC
jgi:hypothetical protein